MKRRFAARAAFPLAPVLGLALVVLQVTACGRPPDEATTAGEPSPPEDWPAQVRRALEAGEAERIDLLFDRGLDPARVLPYAVLEDDVATLRRLLDRGAEASGFHAARALYEALAGDHREAVAILEAAGATLDATDDLGLTLLHGAAARGRTADLRRLLALGADGDLATAIGITPLMSAAAAGRGRSVELLLGAGVEVDRRDRDGWTALHYAARRGEAEIGASLLAAGSDPGAVSVLGWTPLHLASRAGESEMVGVLLVAGADANALSAAAGSPLVLAIQSGDRRSVAELVAAGADGAGSVRGGSPDWWRERLSRLAPTRRRPAAGGAR